VSTLTVGTGLHIPAVPITEHLKPGRVEHALTKVEERRALPVAVEVSLLLGSATHDGLIDGWSTNTSDGLRCGPCAWLKEYGPWVLSGVSRLASDGSGLGDLVPRQATSALRAASGTPVIQRGMASTRFGVPAQ
jgi:hypothetical protein